MDCENCDMMELEMTPRSRQGQDIDYQALVQKAASDNAEVKAKAVRQILRLVSSTMSDYDAETALVNNGVLPVLVNCLANNANLELQYYAAVAITNIASGPSNNCHAVVKAGAVPILISLLSSPEVNVCEQAVWALSNIAGDDLPLKDYVISMGISQPVLKLMTADSPIRTLRLIAWTLSNLCRTSSSSPNPFLDGVWQAINFLVNHKDISVLRDTLWALHQITSAGIEQTQMLIDNGVLPSLVVLMSHENINVRLLAVRTVGNMVLWTDAQTQAVLDCGALTHFRNLLSTKQSSEIICNTARVLSNIAAGPLTQIQGVIDAQLIPLVISKLNDEHLITEFAWIVRNIVSKGNEEQVKYLVRIRVLPPLCKLLTTTKSVVIKGVTNDAVRSLLVKIPPEEIEPARAQIAESISPENVNDFLSSIQSQGIPQNLQPTRRVHQEIDAGDFDNVFQTFQKMKLDF